MLVIIMITSHFSTILFSIIESYTSHFSTTLQLSTKNKSLHQLNTRISQTKMNHQTSKDIILERFCMDVCFAVFICVFPTQYCVFHCLFMCFTMLLCVFFTVFSPCGNSPIASFEQQPRFYPQHPNFLWNQVPILDANIMEKWGLFTSRVSGRGHRIGAVCVCVCVCVCVSVCPSVCTLTTEPFDL